VFLKNKQNITDNGPQAGTAFVTLDEMEFNRRMAIEKELEKSESKSLANVGERFFFFFFFPFPALCCPHFLVLILCLFTVFDDSSNFIIYGTLLGVKGGESLCLASSVASLS